MGTINVDVDIEDVYWAMSKREKKEMVELLSDDGLCIPTNQNGTTTDQSLLDEMWTDEVKKLLTARLHLTKEQEETILEITKNL